MATISTAMANLLCNAIVDAIDVGDGGSLEFRTSDPTEVATLAFDVSHAFGAAASGVATLTTDAVCASAIGGVIADAIIYASGGSTIFSDLTCGVGSGDLQLSSLTIGSGDTVTLTTMTVTMPLT